MLWFVVILLFWFAIVLQFVLPFFVIVIANCFLVVLYCYLTRIKEKELQQTRIYDKHCSVISKHDEREVQPRIRKVTRENNLKQIMLSQGSKKIIVEGAA